MSTDHRLADEQAHNEAVGDIETIATEHRRTQATGEVFEGIYKESSKTNEQLSKLEPYAKTYTYASVKQ
ncbi:hypothetical protein [Haloarcula nitratireducens]|uniref:Uncharacterized protein n=1 Tax=Haloarcula nitratireducens TaxID=2487749 RepID=A0AAW4PHS7_9EURY|nr:hypothetical protein [Halomicroarcula nitratireducens]MBX0297647.1 hypothetical protein [Halomicroarcula nitratireducens]